MSADPVTLIHLETGSNTARCGFDLTLQGDVLKRYSLHVVFAPFCPKCMALLQEAITADFQNMTAPIPVQQETTKASSKSEQNKKVQPKKQKKKRRGRK